MQHELLGVDLFYRMAGHLSSGDTLDEILASVVEAAVVLVNCDECSTYVRQGRELVPWVWKHTKRASLEQARIPLTQGFAAAVSSRRAPIATSENSRQGSTFRTSDQWSRDPGETFVSVPFLSRTRLMGAMTLEHLRPRPYTGHELRLLDLENEKSELLLEQEKRKRAERGKGTLERELGLSSRKPTWAFEHQSQEKKRPLKQIASGDYTERCRETEHHPIGLVTAG